MNNLRTAYFAGLIDGEGNIGVYRAGQQNYSRPELAVKMTCEKTVRAIHAHFGVGSVRGRPPEKAHYKPQWVWKASSKSAIQVLEQVLPYLITKLEDAEKAYACRFIPKKDKGGK